VAFRVAFRVEIPYNSKGRFYSMVCLFPEGEIWQRSGGTSPRRPLR